MGGDGASRERNGANLNMGEPLVSDDMLDRFKAFAWIAGDRRRFWERYFETLLIESGAPNEARLVKRVFRYVEREEAERSRDAE